MSVAKKDTPEIESQNSNESEILNDVKYICRSNQLIIDSLQRGMDVAQLPNGDVLVTEVKTIHTQYGWNEEKQRMVKISQTQ